MGIEPELALVKTKKLVGGGVEKIVNSSIVKALGKLGYTVEAIEEITQYIRDHNTVVGCQVLDKADLPVFATSMDRDNCIPWEAHVNMVAAVQPHISGSISKTINLSNDATVDTVKAAYQLAYAYGCKCITVYRDGCKSTQPINTIKSTIKEETIQPVVGYKPEVQVMLTPTTTKVRNKLPDDRPSLTHKFDIAGHEGYIHVGLYADGTPGEVFITISKEGSFVKGLVDAFATMLSIALQYGAPLTSIVDKLEGHTYDPQGFTSNPDIKIAKSITDYLARYLRKKFLDTVVQVTIEKNNIPAEPKYSGGVCSCGGLLVRNGTCHVCSNCGTSSGCS
jgi:ribonucleoside-diphosphate reductase alpha chain